MSSTNTPGNSSDSYEARRLMRGTVTRAAFDAFMVVLLQCPDEEFKEDNATADLLIDTLVRSAWLPVALYEQIGSAKPRLALGRAIVSKALQQRVSSMAFPPDSLPTLDANQAYKAMLRLCALSLSPTVPLAFGFALQGTTLSKEGRLAVLRQAVAYSQDEFPTATRTLLEGWPVSSLPDRENRTLVKKAIAALKKDEKEYRALPDLKEFHVDPAKLQIFRHIERVRTRDISEMAESKSIFSPFIQRTQVKYSARVALASGLETPEQVLDMKRFGVSIELPQSELLDPLGGAVTRLLLRSIR